MEHFSLCCVAYLACRLSRRSAIHMCTCKQGAVACSMQQQKNVVNAHERFQQVKNGRHERGRAMLEVLDLCSRVVSEKTPQSF